MNTADEPPYDGQDMLERELFTIDASGRAILRQDDAAAPAGAAAVQPQQQKPLSAAKYLHWLAMETHAAQRVALDNLGGFAQPARLEPLKPRTLAKLPAAMPPLVARFLDVQIRLAEDNLKEARVIAEKLSGLGEAFDAGLKLRQAANTGGAETPSAFSKKPEADQQ